MDSTNITNDIPPNEIPTPVIDSTSSLSIHQAVLDIVPHQASSSNPDSQLPSAEILQNIGSAGFPQQSSSSNITISSLHKPPQRNIGHELVGESTASVLKPALSSLSKTSWSVSSMIAEPDAEQVQLSLREEHQDFATNQNQFSVQNVIPAGDMITIPWKPTAESDTNSEHCTATTTVVNVNKMTTASIVLQNAQEDFSVINEDSTTIQEESLPIDAVIETIEEYVGNATRSDPNGQPNEALLKSEKGTIDNSIQQNTDWNFDVNMAFDMHMKKHSENVIDKVGQNKLLGIGSVQSGKFTVTSKGLAPPVQAGVSLIRNITTGTDGRYQDTSGIVRSDANQWEGQNLQFSLNSDPTNVLKVQYSKNNIPTVLQKSYADIHSGFKEHNIQPILTAQPTEQPLHIQNEMYRLGLHVQIDIPDDNVKIVNTGQTFIVPENNTLASSSTEVGNVMVQSTSKDMFWATEEQKKISAGKELENTVFSSTASTSREKNVPATLSMVSREYVHTDLGKHSGAINISDAPHRVLSGTGLLATEPLESIPVPVSVTGNNMEKTTIPLTSSVDTGNKQVRREIAHIVILPNHVEPSDQTKQIVKEVGCKSPVKKKALLIPIKNISREKSNEISNPAQPLVPRTEEVTSESANMSTDQEESLNKEEQPTITLKPVNNAMIECELSVLQRPKKITRYFKEKAKNQETKQKDIQPHEAKEGDTLKEVSSEKDTKQFALDDPNPTPVKLLRNCSGGVVKGPKPFICHQCGRGFSHLGDYNSHVKAHKDGMPFTCKECGVGFRKSGHLINHSRRHTGEKPFACTVCDNTFGQLGTLKRHMRIHTGEKPYQCPTCKKSFSQLSYMKVHRRSHTGERPFKCEVCDHSFLQSGDLKKHMLRKHNTKKELSCPHCSKRFGDKVDIKRHIKTHEGKLVCKTCDKKFSDVESAKAHKQMFHSKEKVKDLPHHCAMCDIGFKLKADLQSHKKNCHPSDKEVKPRGRGKGKRRGRMKAKQTHKSDEDTDTDLEEDKSNLQEVKPTVTVKEESVNASDEQKEREEEDKKETVVRGTRKRKAGKFQPRKLLPPVKQDRPKRTRRSVE